MLDEPTITCPNRGAEIKLAESLAALMFATARKEFADQLKQRDEQIAERERKISAADTRTVGHSVSGEDDERYPAKKRADVCDVRPR